MGIFMPAITYITLIQRFGSGLMRIGYRSAFCSIWIWIQCYVGTHFEKDKNSFAEKNFLQKDIFFLILASEEILSQLKLSKGIFAKKKSFYKHL